MSASRTPIRTRRLALLALAVLVGVGSCVDGGEPTGAIDGPTALLTLVPQYQATAVAEQAGPISRIRVTARQTPGNQLLSTFVTDVDPNAAQWSLDVPVPIPDGGGRVVLTLELLSVANGVETVEYSGRAGPFTLTASTTSLTAPQVVRVVRGPTGNLDVTAVVLSPASARIAEGASVQFEAQVSTSGGSTPTVFWTSLDPTLASVDASGTVRGLLPGQARIVAEAGPRADTAEVTVDPVPTSVLVTPDSIRVTALGQEGVFQAQVRDARGSAILGAAVAWRSLDPLRAGSLGNGRFVALASGRARVEARAVADTLLKDTAVLVVDIPDVDVRITKAVDRARAYDGQQVTFVVTAVSEGTGSAGGLEVEERLPAGLAFVSADATQGSYDAPAGVWRVGTLAGGARATLTLRARLTGLASGAVVVNRARVVGPVADADIDPSDNEDSAQVEVLERLADLALAKTASVAGVRQGGRLFFNVTLTNQGPDTARSVVVADAMPGRLRIDEASPGVGSVENGGLLWRIPVLAPGATATLRLDVTALTYSPDEPVLTNVAQVTSTGVRDPEAGNNRAEASVALSPAAADVQIRKAVDKADAAPGDTVNYTVVVTNAGPDAVADVRVLEKPDAGLHILSYTRTEGSVDEATGIWTVGLMPAGRVDTLTLKVQIRENDTAGKTLVNRASLLARSGAVDPVASNDSASASVKVAFTGVDLSLTKTANKAVVGEADTVTYTVTVSNAGPATATGVSVKDSLDAGLTLASHTTSQGTFDVGTKTWQVGDLAPSASATLTLKAVVGVGTAGQTLKNTAKSLNSQPQPDANAANDTASASVTVPGIDLEVAKSVDVALPKVGDVVRFTVTVTNHGVVDATGVQLRDTIPTGLSVDSATTTLGAWDKVTGIWTIDRLAAGATATLSVKTLVDTGTEGKTLVNEIQRVATTQTDTFPSNDARSASVTVVAPVDLQVKKTLVADTVTAGLNATFTLVVKNLSGTGTATNVVVTDSLPAGLTITTSTPSRGSFDTGTKVWTVGTLAPGDSATLSLVTGTSVADAAKTLQNAAWVSGRDQVESAPANDTARVALTLAEPARTITYSSPANTEVVVGDPSLRPGLRPHLYKPDTIIAGSVVTKITEAVDGCGALTCTTTRGASVTATADGYFTYRPLPDSTGTDSFTFDTDYGGTGTITINLGTKVWYVDGSVATSGSGTSWDPFKTIGETEPPSAPAMEDGPFRVSSGGDIIRVQAGSSYVGAVTLQSNQTLSGGGADLVVGGDTIQHAVAGGGPILSSTVHLATGARVEGLSITGTDGDAIRGTPDGVTIRDVVLSTIGGDGIEFDVASAGTATLDSVTMAAVSGRGLAVRGLTGTLNATHMGIAATGAGSMGIEVFGGAPTVTYSGSASVSGPGFALLQVDSITGGSVSFRGGPYTAVADTAARFRHNVGTIRVDSLTVNAGTQIGVDITTANGATPSYTFNALDINDATGNAFQVVGGAPTVVATVTESSIETTSGRPVYIYGTEGADITFKGGPIKTNGGQGIYVGSNPYGGAPTLSTIRFQGTLDLSVSGSGDAFYVEDGGILEVTGTGNKAVADLGRPIYLYEIDIGGAGVTFQEATTTGNALKDAIYLYDTGTGTFSVTGVGTTAGSGGTITGKRRGLYAQDTGPVVVKNVNITNQSGASQGILAVGVNGLTLDNITLKCDTCGSNDGLVMQNMTGSSTVSNSIIEDWGDDAIIPYANSDGVNGTITFTGNTVRNNAGWGMVGFVNSGGSVTVNASSNTFQNNGSGGILLERNSGIGSSLVFDLATNTFSGNENNAVQINGNSGAATSGKLEGKIRSNTVAHAPSSSIGPAIKVNVADGIGVIGVTDNTLGTSGTPLGSGVDGIYLPAGGGSNANADADYIVTGNEVHLTGDRNGVRVSQTDTGPICLDIKDNDVHSSGWIELTAYDFLSAAVSAFEIARKGASSVAAHVASENQVGSSIASLGDVYTSGSFSDAASCFAPSN